MCILVLVRSVSPRTRFPLLIVHSREEELTRPTTAVSLHDSGVYAAMDERSGGTWMGYNVRTSRFAVLTNRYWPEDLEYFCKGRELGYRARDNSPKISRGLVVQQVLTLPRGPDASFRTTLTEATSDPQISAFGGLNLIFGDLSAVAEGNDEFTFVTNRPQAARFPLRAWVPVAGDDDEVLSFGISNTTPNNDAEEPRVAYVRDRLARRLSDANSRESASVADASDLVQAVLQELKATGSPMASQNDPSGWSNISTVPPSDVDSPGGLLEALLLQEAVLQQHKPVFAYPGWRHDTMRRLGLVDSTLPTEPDGHFVSRFFSVVLIERRTQDPQPDASGCVPPGASSSSHYYCHYCTQDVGWEEQRGSSDPAATPFPGTHYPRFSSVTTQSFPLPVASHY